MDARQAKLEILMDELEVIHNVNNVYWDHQFHSVVATEGYQRRIERLARVREEIKKLQP